MVVNEWQFMAVNHSKVRERDPTKLSEHPLGYVCNWIAFVWQTTNCSAGLCALYWKSFLSLSHILWHIIDTSSSKQTMPSVTIGLSKPYSSCCSCFSMPLKLLECWISILRHSDCWSVLLLEYATPIAGVLSFLSYVNQIAAILVHANQIAEVLSFLSYATQIAAMLVHATQFAGVLIHGTQFAGVLVHATQYDVVVDCLQKLKSSVNVQWRSTKNPSVSKSNTQLCPLESRSTCLNSDFSESAFYKICFVLK